MSRELAPWAADGGKRRPAGRLTDAVGDLRILATGWHWDLAVDVVKAAAGTAVGTVKGDQDAPPIPTAWARTPFLVAVRDLAQTGVLRPVLKAEVNLESHGAEHLPHRSGPSLLVANHASHLDIGAVLATLPPPWRDRTAVALTSDAFFHSWWKAGAAALAFNTFQLPQSEPSADGDTRFEVGPLAKVLASGWNVLVFPEGGRTRDGVVQSFHADVAAVATRLSVPVVPVGVRGTFTAMPQGTRLAAPGTAAGGGPLWCSPRSTTGRVGRGLHDADPPRRRRPDRRGRHDLVAGPAWFGARGRRHPWGALASDLAAERGADGGRSTSTIADLALLTERRIWRS